MGCVFCSSVQCVVLMLPVFWMMACGGEWFLDNLDVKIGSKLSRLGIGSRSDIWQKSDLRVSQLAHAM